MLLLQHPLQGEPTHDVNPSFKKIAKGDASIIWPDVNLATLSGLWRMELETDFSISSIPSAVNGDLRELLNVNSTHVEAVFGAEGAVRRT
jgi:hypothetical protein